MASRVGYLRFSQNDQAIADTWLTEVITVTRGLLVDLQTGTFETSKKKGKITTSDAKAKTLGRMSFYFTGGEAFYDHGFEDMLQCITETMPAALPKRYGYYEPLQETVENDDYSGLVATFHKEPSPIMKSRTPFGHIYMSIPCRKTFERYGPQHFMRRKFLLGKISFELRPKIFSDPSAFSKLRNLFDQLCLLLDVTYAEIVLEQSSGPSWLWYGLPDTRPHTLCVGPTYLNVWLDILKLGHQLGSHHRIISTDRFGNKPPRPPVGLIAPGQGDKNPREEEPDYAPIFPFDYRFDWKKFIW